LFWGFFGSTWGWTQGFTLARQVLYCFSHASSPFCSGYFWYMISHFAWSIWIINFLFMLPTVARMTVTH
jgi:hypothetical protein